MVGYRSLVALVCALTFILSAPPATASASEEWKVAYSVGQFLYSDPPKTDKIFKIHYRAVNGTASSYGAGTGWFSANVTNTDEERILEIKYPRNYPYTNEFLTEPYVQPLLFVNGTETFPEATPAEITDCFFVFSIPFSGNAEIGLSWTYLAVERPYYGDKVPDSCLPETIVDVPTRKDGTITPLQQFKAGVRAEDVVCGNSLSDIDYRLVIHPDGRPFCVTRESATDLIQRWDITIPA